MRHYFGKAEDLRQVLSTFDLIYIRGGNVFILRRAFKQSGADEIIKDLLDADATVYAGYSAGPIMLGPSLHGIETAEDTPSVVPEGYEAEAAWECLGLLPFAIVPHYQSEWLDVDRAMDNLIAYYVSEPRTVHCTPRWARSTAR